MNTMNDACVAKALFNREHINKSITYNPNCAHLLACKLRNAPLSALCTNVITVCMQVTMLTVININTQTQPKALT